MRQQTSRELLLRLERRRHEAARLFCAIVKDTPVDAFAIPGAWDKTAVARQKNSIRNQDNSLAFYRTAITLEGFKQAQLTRQDAMAVVAHLMTIVEELWPTSSIDTAQAIIRAQASDTTEDYLETQALMDTSRIDRWIEGTELYIADAIVAIACLRRDRNAGNMKVAA